MFFNRVLGWVAYDTIEAVHQNPLRIGSDVWCGLNVTICPGCREIGDGAIVGARSVLTRDVLPFTIVAGNPARIIGQRYSPVAEAAVAASKWWLRPLPEVMEHFDLFTNDIDEASLAAFAAAFPPTDPVATTEDA